MLAEKRWPTRQELDAAAPNNPVYIRSIWGYWRGTFPLVSCANTEALKRAGITRDTVSPVPSLVDREGRQRRSDRRLHRAGVCADRGDDLVPRRRALLARRSPARAAGIGQGLSRLRHHQHLRRPRRRERAAARLPAGPPRRHADHALDACVQRELAGGRRRAAWPVRRGLGRMARRARTRRRLAEDGRALRADRARPRRRGARRRPAPTPAGPVSIPATACRPTGSRNCCCIAPQNDIRAVVDRRRRRARRARLSTKRSTSRSR